MSDPNHICTKEQIKQSMENTEKVAHKEHLCAAGIIGGESVIGTLVTGSPLGTLAGGFWGVILSSQACFDDDYWSPSNTPKCQNKGIER